MMKLVAGAVFLAVLGGVSASYLAEKLDKKHSDIETGSAAAPKASTTREKIKVTYAGEDYSGRNTRIKADRRGHFVVEARLNGRRIEVLVDTGATSVAINKSMARRLGINLSSSDFKYQVNTANGAVKAAGAIIDRVEIGRVSVENVQAVVLPDQSLDVILLGMSFLNKLRSFEVKNSELVLRQ